MASSREKNLTLRITGDISDVSTKLETVKADAKAMGVTFSKQFLALSKDGKQLTAVLQLISKETKKLNTLSDKTDVGKKGSKSLSRNLEAEASVRKAALRKEQSEKAAIFRKSSSERLAVVRLQTRAVALETQRGANHRSTILAKNAALLKQIEQKLATDLEKLARKSGRATTTQRKVSGERTSLLNAYKKETAELQKQNAALSITKERTQQVSLSHKSWIRHVTEIVGLYRLVNFGINTVIQSIKAIPKIGIELQTTEAVLTSTLGSSAAAAGAFKFLSLEADRAGKSILGVRENFRNLSASMTLAGEDGATVVDVFTNLNTISTALHLTSEKTQNVFLAIAQIFNKTKVQSEELVKQLGNLLPGAFASFARSMKISTRELTKQLQLGLVDSSKVPEFLRQMSKDFAAAFVIAENGLQASSERLQTSFTNLGEAIFKRFEKPMIATVKSLEAFGKVLTELVISSKGLGSVISSVLTPLLVGVSAGFLAWGAQALYASAATVTLAGTTTVLTAAMVRLQTSMTFLIRPVVMIAGIVAIGAHLTRLGKNSEEAAKSASKFFDEVEEQAKKAETNPVKFSIETKIENDSAVIKLKEKLKDVAERTKVVRDQLKVLAGESAAGDNAFGAAGKIRQKILLAFGVGEAKIAEKKKQLLVLVKSAAKGEAQLATAVTRVTGEIEEQTEKEKLLGSERKKSQDILKAQVALNGRRKEDARLKAEKAYHNLLTQTEIKILTLQGKEKQAAELKLKLQQKTTLQALTGSDNRTQSLKRQLESVKSLQQAELVRGFQSTELLKEKADLTAQEAIIQAKQVAGIITEIEAFDRIKQKKLESLQLSEKFLTLQEAQAGSDPAEGVTDSFEKARQSIALTKLELAGMKRPLTELQQITKQLGNSIENSLGNAFESFIVGAKSAGEAIADFATSVLKAAARMLANELASQLLGAVVGGISSAYGSLSSPTYGNGVSGGNSAGFSNSVSTAFQAKGGINKGLSSVSGTVLSSPTYFPNAKPVPLASGGVVAGEAGAEAVLPLKRNSQGKLGVTVEGSQTSSAGNIYNINVAVTSGKEEDSSDTGNKIALAIMKNIAKQEIANANRPGNQLNKTTVFG